MKKMLILGFVAIMSLSLTGCSGSNSDGLTMEEKSQIFDVLAWRRSTPIKEVTEFHKCVMREVEFSNVTKTTDSITVTVETNPARGLELSKNWRTTIKKEEDCDQFTASWKKSEDEAPEYYKNKGKIELTLDLKTGKMSKSRAISSEK